MSLVYTTEELKFTKNQINAKKGHKHYVCTCYPEDIDKKIQAQDFDKNDVFDYDNSSVIDYFEPKEDVLKENYVKKPFGLEDFMVVKQKKEKRRKKKVSKCVEEEENIENVPEKPKLLIEPQEKPKEPSKITQKQEIMVKKENFLLKRIDRDSFIRFGASRVDKISYEVHPAVKSSLFFDFEIGVDMPQHGRIITRNFGDPEKALYYFQESPEQEQMIKTLFSKSPKAVSSIFPEILAKNTFLNAISYSQDAAKEKAVQMATQVKEIGNKKSRRIEDYANFVCNVCYLDDSEEKSGFALASCMHYSCLECWNEYVTTAISSGQVPIGCMVRSWRRPLNF